MCETTAEAEVGEASRWAHHSPVSSEPLKMAEVVEIFEESEDLKYIILISMSENFAMCWFFRNFSGGSLSAVEEDSQQVGMMIGDQRPVQRVVYHNISAGDVGQFEGATRQSLGSERDSSPRQVKNIKY